MLQDQIVNTTAIVVEMEFDVEVPDYELQGVKTFTQLAEVIDERL